MKLTLKADHKMLKEVFKKKKTILSRLKLHLLLLHLDYSDYLKS